MTYTLTINATNPAELAAVLQSLGTQTMIVEGPANPSLKVRVKKEDPVKQEEETPAAAVETKAPEETKEVTIEQVRIAVQEKAQAGKKAEVKKLLESCSAATVTNLKPNQYAYFLAEVNKL